MGVAYHITIATLFVTLCLFNEALTQQQNEGIGNPDDDNPVSNGTVKDELTDKDVDDPRYKILAQLAANQNLNTSQNGEEYFVSRVERVTSTDSENVKLIDFFIEPSICDLVKCPRPQLCHAKIVQERESPKRINVSCSIIKNPREGLEVDPQNPRYKEIAVEAAHTKENHTLVLAVGKIRSVSLAVEKNYSPLVIFDAATVHYNAGYLCFAERSLPVECVPIPKGLKI